jgi:hypothetical protein
VSEPLTISGTDEDGVWRCGPGRSEVKERSRSDGDSADHCGNQCRRTRLPPCPLSDSRRWLRVAFLPRGNLPDLVECLDLSELDDGEGDGAALGALGQMCDHGRALEVRERAVEERC